MATSVDSVLVESGCLTFTGDQVVHSFPRHYIIKLNNSNFVQWQEHVRLVVEGYELTGFLHGTLPPPSRFVPSDSGSLVLNPSASTFHQQDRLLDSWLLSTIHPFLLPSFTNAQTTSDVWTTAT